MRQWKRNIASEPRWSQSAFKPFPASKQEIFVPPVANHVPHLLITYDRNRIKLTATEVMQRMREGNPRIELNPATGGGPASAGLPGGGNAIVVGVWMLQPGEDQIVARRLHEVLSEGAEVNRSVTVKAGLPLPSRFENSPVVTSRLGIACE